MEPCRWLSKHVMYEADSTLAGRELVGGDTAEALRRREEAGECSPVPHQEAEGGKVRLARFATKTEQGPSVLTDRQGRRGKEEFSAALPLLKSQAGSVHRRPIEAGRPLGGESRCDGNQAMLSGTDRLFPPGEVNDWQLAPGSK